MTLIYKTSGSCTNIEALYTGIKLTTNPSYVPSTAEDAAWISCCRALRRPTPEFDPLDSLLAVNLVPDCAMRVTRSVEGGDLSLYTPAEPCGCYFESKQGVRVQAVRAARSTRITLGLLITFNVTVLRRGIKRVIQTP